MRYLLCEEPTVGSLSFLLVQEFLHCTLRLLAFETKRIVVHHDIVMTI